MRSTTRLAREIMRAADPLEPAQFETLIEDRESRLATILAAECDRSTVGLADWPDSPAGGRTGLRAQTWLSAVAVFVVAGAIGVLAIVATGRDHPPAGPATPTGSQVSATQTGTPEQLRRAAEAHLRAERCQERVAIGISTMQTSYRSARRAGQSKHTAEAAAQHALARMLGGGRSRFYAELVNIWAANHSLTSITAGRTMCH